MDFIFHVHIKESRRTKAEKHLLTIPNCVSALNLLVLRAIKYWYDLVLLWYCVHSQGWKTDSLSALLSLRT